MHGHAHCRAGPGRVSGSRDHSAAQHVRATKYVRSLPRSGRHLLALAFAPAKLVCARERSDEGLRTPRCIPTNAEDWSPNSDGIEHCDAAYIATGTCPPSVAQRLGGSISCTLSTLSYCELGVVWTVPSPEELRQGAFPVGISLDTAAGCAVVPSTLPCEVAWRTAQSDEESAGRAWTADASFCPPGCDYKTSTASACGDATALNAALAAKALDSEHVDVDSCGAEPPTCEADYGGPCYCYQRKSCYGSGPAYSSDGTNATVSTCAGKCPGTSELDDACCMNVVTEGVGKDGRRRLLSWGTPDGETCSQDLDCNPDAKL